jgi:hypothetical protein
MNLNETKRNERERNKKKNKIQKKFPIFFCLQSFTETAVPKHCARFASVQRSRFNSFFHCAYNSHPGGNAGCCATFLTPAAFILVVVVVVVVQGWRCTTHDSKLISLFLKFLLRSNNSNTLLKPFALGLPG